MNCPKCGSEMGYYDAYAASTNTANQSIDVRVCCVCGHEKTVKPC